MPDLISPLKQLATSWRGDLLLAVVLLIWALAYLIVVAAHGEQHWTALIFVLPYAAALAVRRRWPVAAAAVACMALLAVRPLGLDRTIEGPIAVPFL